MDELRSATRPGEAPSHPPSNSFPARAKLFQIAIRWMPCLGKFPRSAANTLPRKKRGCRPLAGSDGSTKERVAGAGAVRSAIESRGAWLSEGRCSKRSRNWVIVIPDDWRRGRRRAAGCADPWQRGGCRRGDGIRVFQGRQNAGGGGGCVRGTSSTRSRSVEACPRRNPRTLRNHRALGRSPERAPLPDGGEAFSAAVGIAAGQAGESQPFVRARHRIYRNTSPKGPQASRKDAVNMAQRELSRLGSPVIFGR
jgi:hypothetical protein